MDKSFNAREEVRKRLEGKYEIRDNTFSYLMSFNDVIRKTIKLFVVTLIISAILSIFIGPIAFAIISFTGLASVVMVQSMRHILFCITTDDHIVLQRIIVKDKVGYAFVDELEIIPLNTVNLDQIDKRLIGLEIPYRIQKTFSGVLKIKIKKDESQKMVDMLSEYHLAHPQVNNYVEVVIEENSK
ncbi:MAG: hypothetical protein ACRCTA_00735 [Bacilli bacterium]